MLNLSRTKLLLGITIILAILILLSVFFLSGNKPVSVEEQKVVEKKTLLFDESSNEVIDPKLQIFEELVVGKSTDQEIGQISGLKSKIETSSGAEYLFPSPLVDRDNMAITKSGILTFKRFITMKDVDHWETPSLISYKEKYGEPESEKKGSLYYGKFEILYVWGSKGIAVIANDYTDEVKEIHVFMPINVEGYLQQYGNDSTQFKEEQPTNTSEEVAL